MLAPAGVFPPNNSAGLSARSCITSQDHEAFLRAIFAPAGHHLSSYVIHTTLARKRTGDAEIGWRPTPEKTKVLSRALHGFILGIPVAWFLDHFTTRTRLRTDLVEPADLIWFLYSKNHLTGDSSITGNSSNISVKGSSMYQTCTLLYLRIQARPIEHSVPPNCSEERRQLEPELAFWSKFASAKAAHVLFLVPL